MCQLTNVPIKMSELRLVCPVPSSPHTHGASFSVPKTASAADGRWQEFHVKAKMNLVWKEFCGFVIHGMITHGNKRVFLL